MLKPIEQCSGELRLEIREVFDYGEYLKRNKIEAIFKAMARAIRMACEIDPRAKNTIPSTKGKL